MTAPLVCEACGETGPGVQTFTFDDGEHTLCFDLELCNRRVDANERAARLRTVPPPAPNQATGAEKSGRESE